MEKASNQILSKELKNNVNFANMDFNKRVSDGHKTHPPLITTTV